MTLNTYYGTVPFLHAFPGTACQATIGRSLRDVACSRLFLVLVLVVEILIMKTGRQGSSSGWLAGREFTLRNTQRTASSTRGDGRETDHALIPFSQTRNSSGSKRWTKRVNIAMMRVSSSLPGQIRSLFVIRLATEAAGPIQLIKQLAPV